MKLALRCIGCDETFATLLLAKEHEGSEEPICSDVDDEYTVVDLDAELELLKPIRKEVLE